MTDKVDIERLRELPEEIRSLVYPALSDGTIGDADVAKITNTVDALLAELEQARETISKLPKCWRLVTAHDSEAGADWQWVRRVDESRGLSEWLVRDVPVLPEMTIYAANGTALLVMAVSDNDIIEVKRVGVADAGWYTMVDGKSATAEAAAAGREGA